MKGVRQIRTAPGRIVAVPGASDPRGIAEIDVARGEGEPMAADDDGAVVSIGEAVAHVLIGLTPSAAFTVGCVGFNVVERQKGLRARRIQNFGETLITEGKIASLLMLYPPLAAHWITPSAEG